MKRNIERFPDDFMFQLRKDELDTQNPPIQGIFYDGQVFDAYRFVSDLMRKAEQSLILNRKSTYIHKTIWEYMPIF